jgi:hypothetical protein
MVFWLVSQFHELGTLVPSKYLRFVVSQYDIYINDAILHADSPPGPEFAIQSMSVGSL